MAFLRYANARVINHRLEYTGGWDNVRVASGGPRMDRSLVDQAEKILKADFDPKKYLLTHATIVASVDTVPVKNARLGATTEGGKRIVRKTADYRIKADCDKYINNNLDSWARDVLLKSYKTFVGAHSFVEHVQIEDLSKGRIIDAVARDVGDSVYVDILVANDRKHSDLIEQIESGKLSTLSMGCFLPGTQVTMEDGTRVAIEDVQVGDLVLTHKGRAREVLNKQIRGGKWGVRRIEAVGVPSAITATDIHPFFVYRLPEVCACGCGESLPASYSSGKRTSLPNRLRRKFKDGHHLRILNPNGSYSMDEYASRKARLQEILTPRMEEVRAADLKVGDFLVFPRSAFGEIAGTTVGKARLLGYFLAEGNFLKANGERREVEFNFSLHEKDTYAAEVCDLLREVFPGCEPRVYLSDENDGCAATVRVSGPEIAEWFYQYGGEYSHGKRLHPEVLRWDVESQLHLLGAWINGDGHLQKAGVTSVATVSYDLACQMHAIMARCGICPRMYGGIQGRMMDVAQVVNGGLNPVLCDDGSYRRPVFQLDLGQTQAQALRDYSDKVKPDPKFSRQECRVLDDVIMFPITSIEAHAHEGWVYDMEVEEDHSYVVEGVAVHNCSIDGSTCTKCGHWAADETEFCDHIRYQKGNTFFDENGQRHRIAELCGDVSLDPTGGVTFIEASWVAVPAFTGAVARNIISVDTGTSKGKKAAEKIKRALETPTRAVDPNAMKKAANFVLAEDDPFSDVSDAPADAPAAPADAGAPAKSPLDDLRDQIKKTLLDKVKEDLVAEITESKLKKELANPTAMPTDPNDTIVKQAGRARQAGLRVAYQAAVREIVKTASSDVDLVNRVATLNGEMGVSVPRFVYRAALKVGASEKYSTLQSFLSGCKTALGREPTGSEAKTLLRLASILTAARSNRRHAEKLVKEK